MFGRRTFTVSLFLAAAATAQAATDYFPLQVGNQWVYWSSLHGQGLSQTVEVKKTVTYGGQDYALYAGMEGAIYLRLDENGTLFAWDAQSQTETPLAPFNSDDAVLEPRPNPCRQTGRIVSRNAQYKGPIGEFDYALEVRYSPGVCADAGVERELYLPWIGLVQRTTTTIAGPRTYDLIYARLGGVTVVSGPEVSFGLALNQATYSAGDRMRARLAIRNQQPDPLSLQFASGQVFDFAIRNEKGDRVYLWSDGKAFTQMLQTIEVQGEQNFPIEIPLGSLAPGKYTAEAWLTTMGVRQWSATAGFEIR